MKSLNEINLESYNKMYNSVTKNTIISNLMALGFIKVSSEENEYNVFYGNIELNILIEDNFKDNKIILNAYYNNSYFKSSVFFDSDKLTIETSIEYLIENLFFKYHALNYKKDNEK